MYLKKLTRAALTVFGLVGFSVVAAFLLAQLGYWDITQARPDTKTNAAITPTLFGSPSSASQQTCTSFASAVQKAAPAIVSINTAKTISMDNHPLFRDPFFRHFFGDQLPGMPAPKEQLGLGSGVIIDAQGYVLTNYHVIEGATDVTVTLNDGRDAKAKIIGADPETDLAVLKLSIGNLPVVEMGSADSKQVGDIVLAIGNPFGVGQTVTQGIISAMRRSNLELNHFENFIQTDAAINPGNSGGALIDVDGKLIGINTAIFTNSGGSLGIGFAIPIDLARDVMDQLIKQGHVTRGFMGVNIQDLDDQTRKRLHYKTGNGVVVVAVVKGGPAYKSGIRTDDIITSIDGKDVESKGTVLSLTAKLKPEEACSIDVMRNGVPMEFRVVIIERPYQKPKEEATSEADDEEEEPQLQR